MATLTNKPYLADISYHVCKRYCKLAVDAPFRLSLKGGTGNRGTGGPENRGTLAALLPVTASGCGVTTVPMPILRAMFETLEYTRSCDSQTRSNRWFIHCRRPWQPGSLCHTWKRELC